jgi:hypothetical protein
MNNKIIRWVNQPINNVDIYGFIDNDRKYLKSNICNKPLKYLNSNKYQCEYLFNKLIKTSNQNNQYYSKYEYINNTEIFDDYHEPLFDKSMLKDFIKFCYNQK